MRKYGIIIFSFALKMGIIRCVINGEVLITGRVANFFVYYMMKNRG